MLQSLALIAVLWTLAGMQQQVLSKEMFSTHIFFKVRTRISHRSSSVNSHCRTCPGRSKAVDTEDVEFRSQHCPPFFHQAQIWWQLKWGLMSWRLRRIIHEQQAYLHSSLLARGQDPGFPPWT
eukprot:TRINITY_DN42644_c0_g1_i1.p1 TRINITY_DN42644_c0_g1~~TRINITY_DN42644_c0_g1_i1.p1  ORF type:complete len:123 (+),score=20.93 TRINITY_DN42644_c0_g1_i1:1293-1661(+)